MSPSEVAVRRRVVLIDLGWAEADLLPELLRGRGVTLGLVAGASAGDPGVRVAGLLGVRRTTDLSDLTRELFDAAWVGEASSRRAPLERLLAALDTPVLSLAALRGWADAGADSSPSVDAAEETAGHLPALDLDAALSRVLPDLDRDPAGGTA